MLINDRHLLLLINSVFDVEKPTLIEEIVSVLSDKYYNYAIKCDRSPIDS